MSSNQKRPRIVILGRIADHTSVTRLSAIVTAERLARAVWAAGGEPITLLPVADSNWEERLEGIGGVLMPGGGDINPERYGQSPTTEHIYGVDELQDEADFSLYRYAKSAGLPILAICRGFQLVNVAEGGTLVQHMSEPHLHKIHEVKVDDPAALGFSTERITSSCYHHQSVDQLGTGLNPQAVSETGNIEAFTVPAKQWIAAVQWHPEDNFEPNPENLEIFARLVAEARKTPSMMGR